MSLNFEKIYPYLISLVCFILWQIYGPGLPEGGELLSATLSVSGVFVGFLTASKAILISTNSKTMERLKESGYIFDLVSYIGQSIWFNLIFCLVCVIGFFDNVRGDIYSSVWIFLFLTSFFTVFRVTQIMLKIFRNS